MRPLKKQVDRAKEYLMDNPLTISIAVFLLLIVGLVVTVDQSTKQQNQASHAQEGATLTNCDVSPDDMQEDSEEQKLFQLVNNYRQQHNLPALTEIDSLDRSAAWQSLDMAKNNSFAHQDSAGRMPPDRAKDCGYTEAYSQVLENIHAGTGAGSETAQDTFTGWKNSPLHNQTMLDNRMVVAGVARTKATNADYDWYWTMDFGDRALGEGGRPPTPTGNNTNTKKPKKKKARAIARNTTPSPEPTCPLDGSAQTQSVGAGGAIVGGNKKSSKDSKKQDTSKKDTNKNTKDNNTKNTNNNNNKKNNNKSGKTTGTPEPTSDTSGDCNTPTEDPNNPQPTDETTPPDNQDNNEITPPDAPSIQFTINIPGIDSNSTADDRDLTVEFSDANNTVVKTDKVQIGVTDGNTFVGYYDLSSLKSGVYQIKVKLANSLRKLIPPPLQTIDVTKNLDLQPVTMVMGDFDNNNVLNIYDFNIFKNCMDVSFGDEEVSPTPEEDSPTLEDTPTDNISEDTPTDDPSQDNQGDTTESLSADDSLGAVCAQHDQTDLNEDGTVDLLDYNLLLDNFQNAKGN